MRDHRGIAGALAVAAVALLASACSSSGPAASSAELTPANTPTASATSTPRAIPASVSPVASTAAPVVTTSPAGSPAPGSCASMATRTFLHITAANAASDGSLALTGNPAALVCGGPDDSHFNTSGSTVTAHVVPGAAIKVFPVSKMSPEPIQPGKLAAYLATDDDTRIFLVTGPLTAITG